MSRPPTGLLELAEDAWRWVLDQVRWDDEGPWIPEAATAEPAAEPDAYRDGMHSGIGGLAHVLAEVRALRAWTDEEQRLAEGIGQRLRSQIATQVDCTYFDGLVSTIGALVALRQPGVEAAVDRLAELSGADGWPQTVLSPPKHPEGTRISDLTLGTAGVLLGALWARRCGTPGAEALAVAAAEVLLAEAEEEPTGLNWLMTPRRFHTGQGAGQPPSQMPNLSHGLAGIATALALAGAELARPDLRDAARRGAEHLVTLGEGDAETFVVPCSVPDAPGRERVTYTWCHGPTGLRLLFESLELAGVATVAGVAPATWRRRCLHAVRTSGLPERLRPGFWDNDGRCCGTAGVGEAFLAAWHRDGDAAQLAFAMHLADTLAQRAVRNADGACWRFLEHRADEPLLPPGVGWMQGAAGIAAYLFHAGRVAGDPAAAAVPRMDTWWSLAGIGPNVP